MELFFSFSFQYRFVFRTFSFHNQKFCRAQSSRKKLDPIPTPFSVLLVIGGRRAQQTMGNMWYAYVSHPDTAPDIKNPPTFDPLIGFPEGRVERSKAVSSVSM